ncbi:MAG: hypothetical protein WBN40_00735 [Pseudomonadales bacterium]
MRHPRGTAVFQQHPRSLASNVFQLPACFVLQAPDSVGFFLMGACLDRNTERALLKYRATGPGSWQAAALRSVKQATDDAIIFCGLKVKTNTLDEFSTPLVAGWIETAHCSVKCLTCAVIGYLQNVLQGVF